jgi:sugar/nucleoside kinase (ribokinase family)
LLLPDTKSKAIVVRSGKDGCYVATKAESAWLPAYHQEASKVIDPTGGGNTFLGGFSITLARSPTVDFASITQAVISGAVAASFAIEQIGMPILGVEGESESWNGDSVQRLIDELTIRINNS